MPNVVQVQSAAVNDAAPLQARTVALLKMFPFMIGINLTYAYPCFVLFI